MKKIRLILITLTAAALTACSKDKDLPGKESDPVNPNTTEAFATFSINVPADALAKSKATKATSEESAIKTLHVFIYDVASPHTSSVGNFSTADNTLQPTTNGWKTSTPIRTLKADKYIFVGVNLTPAIVSEINAKGFGAFNYKEFAQSVDDLANAGNGFVMFNASFPAVTPEASLPTSKETAANNPISVTVSRAIAKAAVFKGQNFVVNGGGTMQDITYGWRNINKQFYFIQKLDGGIVKDYNWDSYNMNDFVRGTDAIPVNAYSATPAEFTYALENTFNYVPMVSLVDQATFLSIRGQFRPDKIIQIKTGTINAQTSDDFETIDNPNSYGTFYTVRTDDGISNYFIKGTDAEQYAGLCISQAQGMPGLSGSYTLQDNTYNNGMCYYHVHVNSNASGQYTPYGIYRNQYYRINLNSIQAPGNPDDNFDQNQVIRPNTWVNVEIIVNDWEVVDEDRDL